MPLQATSGAASYDAFGGGVPVVPQYIEDVFSTFLRLSDGTNTQAIVNNIDLSTKGGLVWSKPRAAAGENHIWVDSARGLNKYLSSDLTSAQGTMGTPYVFNTNGFTSANGNFWANGVSLVDWTFRKQPKFFDVVTYTGTGSAQDIAHSLGSTPGCIIVKNTEELTSWAVYHRSLGGTYITRLNTSGASETGYENWANTDPTSTVFTVGNGGATNRSAKTYVAYLFAHNAGGFGLTGTDNVISCGSAADGNSLVTLGYEPQWVLIKGSQGSIGVGDNWLIADAMRGMVYSGNTPYLAANLSSAEDFSGGGGSWIKPTATGFQLSNLSGTGPFIYIAIRRGPMKVPTSGTSVFQPTVWTGTGAALQQNVNINYDAFLQFRRNGGYFTPWMDKLRGFGYSLYTQSTNAEVNQTAFIAGPKQNNYINFVDGTYNLSGEPWLNDAFVRAPSFFDEVCYTGTGSNTTVAHNLTVVPELLMVKRRDATASWHVGSTLFPNYGDELSLNSTASIAAGNVWQNTPNTATYFTLRTNTDVNASGGTYVAYLFATCAGVSKVFSYTGNGSSQTINCGFTAGSRWVMIKRTDSAGDWYVWDSARGIVSGNDPHLSLNTTDAEVTTDDTIDTDSTGFVVNQVSATNVNVSSATYIGIAIA